MSTNRVWMFSTLALLSVAVASAGIAKSKFEAPRTVVLARSNGTPVTPYAKGQEFDEPNGTPDNLTVLVTNDKDHPIPVVEKSREQQWDYLYFENFKEAFEYFNVQQDGTRISKENLLKQLGQRGWRLLPAYGTALIFEKAK